MAAGAGCFVEIGIKIGSFSFRRADGFEDRSGIRIERAQSGKANLADEVAGIAAVKRKAMMVSYQQVYDNTGFYGSVRFLGGWKTEKDVVLATIDARGSAQIRKIRLL